MKLKKFEVVEICETIDSLNISKDYKFFLYVILKARKKLEDDYLLILETIKPDVEYIKFIQERKQIIDKYCEKNEEKLIDYNNKYKVIEGNEEIVKKEVENLFNKYKESIEKRKKEIKDIEIFLNSEIEVDLDKISIQHVPNELNKAQMNCLLPLIVD
jgi:dsDNA-specific endonuclease/ATPase MutS2